MRELKSGLRWGLYFGGFVLALAGMFLSFQKEVIFGGAALCLAGVGLVFVSAFFGWRDK